MSDDIVVGVGQRFVYPDDIVAIARRNYFDGEDPRDAADYLSRMLPEVGRAATHLLDMHAQLTVLVGHCGAVAVAGMKEVREALVHAADMSNILLEEGLDDLVQTEGVLSVLLNMTWPIPSDS